MFRHGLRVTETIGLRWDQVDLKGSASCTCSA
jgi:integrase